VLGHYRPVHVKSRKAQFMSPTLIARSQIIDNTVKIENSIRGILRVQGLKLGIVHRCSFEANVVSLLEEVPELRICIASY